MKKLLIALLAVSMIFVFTACGETESAEDTAVAETFTAIPLGGDLPDYELEGPAYGEYVKLDTPTDFMEKYGADTLDIYYSEGSDTPYIMVFRWKDVDMTLDEFSKSAAEESTPGGNYTSFDLSGRPATVFDTSSDYIQDFPYDGFYYISSVTFADGNDFVAIDFHAATEEVALGDSGKYLWIPTGYDSVLSTEEMEEHKSYLCGTYDDSYYMPYIFIGELSNTYDELEWFWGDVFKDGLPVDEATYKGWNDSGWNESAVAAYYKAFGIDITIDNAIEVDGCRISYHAGTAADGDTVVGIVDSYIHVGDKTYELWLSSDLDPAPQYAIFNSLHSK